MCKVRAPPPFPRAFLTPFSAPGHTLVSVRAICHVHIPQQRAHTLRRRRCACGTKWMGWILRWPSWCAQGSQRRRRRTGWRLLHVPGWRRRRGCDASRGGGALGEQGAGSQVYGARAPLVTGECKPPERGGTVDMGGHVRGVNARDVLQEAVVLYYLADRTLGRGCVCVCRPER